MLNVPYNVLAKLREVKFFLKQQQEAQDYTYILYILYNVLIFIWTKSIINCLSRDYCWKIFTQVSYIEVGTHITHESYIINILYK